MPKKPKKKAWREFERLVATIEGHLIPKGAEVRSPDRIPDKRTGNLREVDASIRYEVGSIPLLITIECRDRAKGEDVTWIEQLVTKRDAIGASCTVAVSSTSFSTAAEEAARQHGIELRLLREVSDDAIREWAEQITILMVQGRFWITRIEAQLRPTETEPRPEFSDEFRAAVVDAKAKLFKRPGDGAEISVLDLLRGGAQDPFVDGSQVLDRGFRVFVPAKTTAQITLGSSIPGLFENVPTNGDPVTKHRSWSFGPGELHMNSTAGPTEIEELRLDLRVVQRAYPASAGRLLAYTKGAEQVSRAATMTIMGEKKIDILLTETDREED